MNPEPNRLPEPATYTDLAPRWISAECEAWLAEYREQILASLQSDAVEVTPPALLEQAVNEADALASLTPFPALFLPALLEEKVAQVRAWNKRQRRVLADSEVSFAA